MKIEQLLGHSRPLPAPQYFPAQDNRTCLIDFDMLLRYPHPRPALNRRDTHQTRAEARCWNQPSRSVQPSR
jgi:hypothetical protein